MGPVRLSIAPLVQFTLARCQGPGREPKPYAASAGAQSAVANQPPPLLPAPPSPPPRLDIYIGRRPRLSSLLLHLLCGFLASCFGPVSDCTRLSCDFDHLSLLARCSSGIYACWVVCNPLRRRIQLFTHLTHCCVLICCRAQAKLSVYKLVSLCVQLHLAKRFTAVLIVVAAISLAFHVTSRPCSDLSNSHTLLQV